MPTDPPVLLLEGVHRTTDGVAILRGIDWRVERGQHWVVLGPNGCGKTTLVRIASMWLHPSSGDVTVLGERLGRTDVRSLRRRIGFASASMADLLRGDLTVRDVVMTARHAALEPWWHDYDDADREAARRALERVGIDHLETRRFGACSSGERQRVLVARALSTDPGIVLLDEPTAALDLAWQHHALELARALTREGVGILAILHDLALAAMYADRVALLVEGQLVKAGAPAQVLSASNLQRAYGVRARWLDIPDAGALPVVLGITPRSSSTSPEQPDERNPHDTTAKRLA